MNKQAGTTSRPDVASGWANRSSRQRGQLAARYSREAATYVSPTRLAAATASRSANAAKARTIVDALTPASLSGLRDDGTAFTRAEMKALRDVLAKAWRVLKLDGSDFVTVSS